MARFKFFLGANPEIGENPDLACQILMALNDARKGADFPEHFVDMMAMLADDNDECAEAICESGERIYELECESDIMDSDEAQEALSLTLFEGGSLNPDLRLIALDNVHLCS